MKVRIKFRKWGVMKFIGHLDMMRYFQKAMRRAKIDICYSEGFSPHQIMSFAAPLGVGITSDGEYFDIEVHTSRSSADAVAALNAVMVEGVEVTSYVRLPDSAKPAMAVVAAADYRLSYKEGSPYTVLQWQEALEREFWNQKEFMVLKKSKKSERELDLKPLVYAFSVSEKDAKPEFFLSVSIGSTDNLKPELVLAAVCERCGLGDPAGNIQIHRDEVYARSESGELVALEAMGEILPEVITFTAEGRGEECSVL